MLLAEAVQEKGVRFDVLIGHSFGELPALAVAGAFDVPTGLEIVAQRVLALRAVADDAGAMLALSCAPERARALVETLELASVTLAVINHPRQTVLAGPRTELARVEAAAPDHGTSATLLKSRYPFHSPLLSAAAERFGTALRGMTFSAPRSQVYSPIEGGLYTARTNFPAALSSHLVRSFDFRDAVATLHQAGVRSFIECGAGGVLSTLVRKNLPDAPQSVARSAVLPDRSVGKGGRVSHVSGMEELSAGQALSRARVRIQSPGWRSSTAFTGLMLWAKVLVANHLPRWWLDVATAIHFYEAVLATLAIVVWHF